MGISLKPKHVARYRDLAALLMKYGRSDAVRQAGLEQALPDSAADRDGAAAGDPRDDLSDELASDLERLGPTYVKLGQLLASRADFLPASYTEALERLQDKVEPFPYADVEETIERELGVRISKAFSEFDPEPLAAASLGQVHRARLRDGRAVAVKVQRPNIRERILADLEALNEVAQFADEHTDAGRRMAFAPMLEEFRQSMMRELDYIQEARNLSVFARNLREFELIVVPEPVDDYTTSCVLTMEYVRGRKVTAVSPLRLLEIDGAALGDELFRAYLKQILVDGVFHADPHAGNVFLTEDNRIALIDLGMVGHLAPGLQDQLIKMLLAISEGRGEEVAEIVLETGTRLDGFNEKAYTRAVARIVARHFDAAIEQIDIGRIIIEVTRTAGENGVRIPPELTMLGKTLLNLDQVSRILDPGFRPSDAIQRHAAEIMRQRMMRAMSPTNLMANALEMGQLVQHLPARVNKLLERLVNNEIEVRVNAIDEAELITGIQKVANRITTGLILAALIIGAAMLMQVETSWTILGYPGLAMLFFLIAGLGGIVLVLDIFLTDRKN
ncbi:MAG TPA: AarF/UbiB family protein [Longimicrobiales bacterium]|nr:AarF/UbiB family protein [Longimicrobiales bacterium]